MKEHIARRWIKALRSGHYQQTKRRLCAKTKSGQVGHCCLGVLCCLKPGLPTGERVVFDSVYGWLIGTVFGEEEEAYELPQAVQVWADMQSARGGLYSDLDLTCLNDEYGFTFDDIADVIYGMIRGGIIDEL